MAATQLPFRLKRFVRVKITRSSRPTSFLENLEAGSAGDRKLVLKPSEGPMGPPRRAFKHKEPSLDRATSVGVTLPSFNFVERPQQRRRERARTSPAAAAVSSFPVLQMASSFDEDPAAKASDMRREIGMGTPTPSMVDLDDVLYHAVSQRALRIKDPNVTQETKMARIWQALLRHSERGRFGPAGAGGLNPICSALCLEATDQILAACGASALLRSVLIGGLANSIYAAYDPDIGFEEHSQHADVAKEQEQQLVAQKHQIDKLTEQRKLSEQRIYEQLSASGVGQLLQQMELSRRLSAVTEMLGPVLDDELLLVLWNATATTQAAVNLRARMPAAESESGRLTRSWKETRKRAAALANLVLQERVRLVATVWQALSTEEKRLAHKALDPNSSAGQSAATLKSVLRALEETYVSEQIHHQRQLSRRNLNLASQLEAVGESSSVDMGNRLLAPRALGKLRSKARAHTQVGDSSISLDLDETGASIPQVLVGALVPSSSALGRLNQLQLTQTQHQGRSRPVNSGILPEQLLASHSDVLRTCEDVFDLLCELEEEHRPDGETTEDDRRHASSEGADGEDHVLVKARRKLRDLLCTYVEPSEPIQDRYARCEDARERRLELEHARTDDEQRLAELVRALVAGQRRHPSLLVNAVNRSPETLLSAMAYNPGMLFFAMTKFTEPVKRFLRLDAKACEHLDALALRYRGVQLLWGSHGMPLDVHRDSDAERGLSLVPIGQHDYLPPVHEDLAALVLSPPDAVGHESSLLLEWFTSHLGELAQALLAYPKPLQLLFVEMHERGDVSTFYQLMLQLQQTKGVHNFMTRASVATLERLAQEDQAAILVVLRDIFQGSRNSGKVEYDINADPANADLLHELQASPHLAACLSAFHPTVLQDIFSAHIDAWTPYFVDTVASNDTLLRQCLMHRTEHVEGGDTLLRLFSVVMEGSTASLNLPAMDSALCVSDVEQAKKLEASARRKELQCLYLHGRSTVFRAVVAPQVGTVGYNPRRFLKGSAGVSVVSTVRPVAVAASIDRTNKEPKIRRPSLRPRPKRMVPSPPVTTTTSATATGTSAASTPARKRPVQTGDGSGSDQITAVFSGESAVSVGAMLARGGEIPPTWQMYLRAHASLRSREANEESKNVLPALSKARVKALVLDIWLEFLKVEYLQLETVSLYSIAPFACDYFAARYDEPTAVGARLDCLLTALLAHQDDPRVGFFASACGLGEAGTSGISGAVPPTYDMFLYYLHALGHLFYGKMKIFQPGNRLDETTDGSCPINIKHALAAASTLFSFSLTESAMRALHNELTSLPSARETVTMALSEPSLLEESSEEAENESDKEVGEGASDSSTTGREKDATTTHFVELDDVMEVLLQQWRAKFRQLEERYRQAFAAHDLGGNRIGLDEFIKIVTGVTAGRISARECRLVYGDAGQEFLDLDTFVSVTRAYQLRAFDIHLPEVELEEQDLQDLRLSVGRANISSTQREVEDLVRYWCSVRADVTHQLEAAHQKRATKSALKKQSAVIEKLVSETPQLQHQLYPSRAQTLPAKRQATSPALVAALQEKLERVWHEVRTCVKMLHRAKLTQHYLSGLFIRSNMVSWIRQARRRAQEEERQRTLEALNC